LHRLPARIETSFIQFVVQPLYALLVTILPDLDFTLTLIEANKARWEDITNGARA